MEQWNIKKIIVLTGCLGFLVLNIKACGLNEEESDSLPFTGSLEWAVQSGDDQPFDNDGSRAVAVLDDGAFYVTGGFQGNISFGADCGLTLSAGGVIDVFVARYNSEGAPCWSAQGACVPINACQGTDLAIGTDGSVFVLGTFDGQITFGAGTENETTLFEEEDEEVFLVHYNSDGSLAFAKRLPSRDSHAQIASLSDGSVVVGAWDMVARYSASGSQDWKIENDDARFNLLDTNAQDDIFVLGTFYGSDITLGEGEANETTLDNPTPIDGVFIARYNSDGTLSFARVEAGDSDTDFGLHVMSQGRIAAVGDGGFVWAGIFAGHVTLGWGGEAEQELSAPYEGQFMARYDRDGELIWINSGNFDGLYSIWGVDGFDDGSSVFAVTLRGQAVLAASQPEEMVFNTSNESMILARYEADGTLAWAHTGTFTVDRNGGVAAGRNGESIFTSGFFGTATFGYDDSEQTILDGNEGTIFIAKYTK